MNAKNILFAVGLSGLLTGCESARPRVLVCALEPFGGDSINISREVLKKLLPEGAETIGDYELIPHVFPVNADSVRMQFNLLVEKHKPDFIIGMGQSGTETAFGVNRIVLETQDYTIGEFFHKMRVDSTVIDSLVSRLGKAGILTELSDDPGTHRCNELLARSLEYMHDRGRDGQACFLHIPSEQHPEIAQRKSRHYASALRQILEDRGLPIKPRPKPFSHLKFRGTESGSGHRGKER